MELKTDKKIWITSDSHYAHLNICRGVTKWRTEAGEIPVEQTRDFSSLEKMNDAIVRNINKCVGQDDVLVHLGDWSFGGFENIAAFRYRIVCQEIHLVLGNHDHHIERNREGCQDLFTTVNHYLRLIHQGRTIELLHYPISSWNGLRKGRIHLHGHCHLPHHLKISNGRRMDVGMDGHPEFRPYDLFRECIVPLEKVEIGSELGAIDHHL